MSKEDRQAAEFWARQVAELMDRGSPRTTPFDAWLADYFMRFLAERSGETRRLALKEANEIAMGVANKYPAWAEDHQIGALEAAKAIRDLLALMATGRGQAGR